MQEAGGAVCQHTEYVNQAMAEATLVGWPAIVLQQKSMALMPKYTLFPKPEVLLHISFLVNSLVTKYIRVHVPIAKCNCKIT